MGANGTEWRDTVLSQEEPSASAFAADKEPLPPRAPSGAQNADAKPAPRLPGWSDPAHPGDATNRVCARGREMRQLVEAVERGADRRSARAELVLVTGPSGAGKSVLVHATLGPSCDPDAANGGSSDSSDRSRGLFVSGKFDLLERSEQYYPFVQAFSELVRCTIQDPRRLGALRAALAPLKETFALLLDLVPDLAILFEDSDATGARDSSETDSATSRHSMPVAPIQRCTSLDCEQAPLPPLSSPSHAFQQPTAGAEREAPATNPVPSSPPSSSYSTARARLKMSIRNFLEAVGRATSRLVLFLDDLQWADPSSLDLLGYLFRHKVPGLAIVGACRDDELSSVSHLSVLLRELEASSVVISQVRVDNLGREALLQLLGEMYDLDTVRAQILGGIVVNETGGNMFHVVQFLRALMDEKLLRKNRDGSWCFESEAKIRSHLTSGENVARLVAFSIQKQDQTVQDTLMVASCLGTEFSEALLEEAVSYDVEKALRTAEARGFLVRSVGSASSWRFAHDQIQLSAYSLIPPHERELVHLRIGRTLWRGLGKKELDEHAGIVVKQLRLGARLMDDEAERQQMAHLLLQAGEQAARSASHLTAQEYLSVGMSLLGRRHWRDQYDLSLSLYNASAEVEYCLGNFDRMDELTTSIFSNARLPSDKIRAQTSRMYSLGSRNKLPEAIDFGLTVLKETFAISFPRRISPVTILTALLKTRIMLRRRSDQDLLSLPPIKDGGTLAAMRIMVLLFSYALNSRPMLAPLLSMRLINYALVRGSSSLSSVIFGNFAILMSMAFRDADAGIRFGRLAVRIQESSDGKEWLPRVNCAVYGYCFSCLEPLREQLPPLLLAHRVGLGSGDIEFAMLSASYYVAIGIFAGTRLCRLENDVSSFLELLNLYQQRWIDQFVRPCAQFIRCLLGSCLDPSILDGTALHLRDAIKDATETKNVFVIPIIQLFQLILYSYFGKYEDAEQVGHDLSSHGATPAITCYSRASLLLHHGVSLVALSYHGRRRRRLGLARRALRRLTRLREAFTDATYGNKVSLLEAEILAADGRYDEARDKYQASLALATREKTWSEVGLAHELHSRMLLRRGEKALAAESMDRAASAYERWGAAAKVEQIRSLPAGRDL